MTAWWLALHSLQSIRLNGVTKHGKTKWYNAWHGSDPSCLWPLSSIVKIKFEGTLMKAWLVHPIQLLGDNSPPNKSYGSPKFQSISWWGGEHICWLLEERHILILQMELGGCQNCSTGKIKVGTEENCLFWVQFLLCKHHRTNFWEIPSQASGGCFWKHKECNWRRKKGIEKFNVKKKKSTGKEEV